MKKTLSNTEDLRRARRSILRRDFYVSLGAASVLLIAWLVTDELEGGRVYFIAAVPASLVLAGLAWTRADTLANWISSDKDYGEILRITDPEEARAHLPFRIVIAVCFVSAAVALVGAIIVEGIHEKVVLAGLHAAALFLFLWSLLGVASLSKVMQEHRRLRARVARLKEQSAVEQRERSVKPPPDPHQA